MVCFFFFGFFFFFYFYGGEGGGWFRIYFHFYSCLYSTGLIRLFSFQDDKAKKSDSKAALIPNPVLRGFKAKASSPSALVFCLKMARCPNQKTYGICGKAMSQHSSLARLLVVSGSASRTGPSVFAVIRGCGPVGKALGW